MNDHVGDFRIPKHMRDYVERNGDQLVIEQSVHDVNGYALGINTKVSIKRLYERCDICGYHSIWNPNQKKLLAENRHRLQRGYDMIFQWDDYGLHPTPLEEAFDEETLENQIKNQRCMVV